MKRLTFIGSVTLWLSAATPVRAELMAHRVESYGARVFALGSALENHGARVRGQDADGVGNRQVDVAKEEAAYQARALGLVDTVVRSIREIAVCEHHGPAFDTEETAEIAQAIEREIVVHADRMAATLQKRDEEARHFAAVSRLIAELHEKHEELEREGVIYDCSHGADATCE